VCPRSSIRHQSQPIVFEHLHWGILHSLCCIPHSGYLVQQQMMLRDFVRMVS
jgi:hypothetical protein